MVGGTEPRLTLFTTTRPFEGTHAVHQLNALRAWTQLTPPPQVLLIGDDPGAEEAARLLGLEFSSEVRRSPSGLPYLSDIFAEGQALARSPICGYANADIIFPRAIQQAADIAAAAFDRFLMIGQRWDLSIDHPLDLAQPSDWLQLGDDARQKGVLRGPYWVDYFVFPGGMFESLPDLILGRPGWDNWLVWHTRDRHIPVIDATDYLLVVHHDHHRGHGPRKSTVAPGSDSAWNRDLIGSEAHMFTVGHATHRLTAGGALVRARGPKYLTARVLNHLHPLLRITRPVRHRLGIQADTAQQIAVRLRRHR